MRTWPTNYRHILKLKGYEETLEAECTPPHDIPGRLVDEYRPKGCGNEFLNSLMKQSEDILRDHPVNVERKARGESTADTIWLFWGSDKAPVMPSFMDSYGLGASVTSAVDVIRGLAMMLDIDILEIPGITATGECLRWCANGILIGHDKSRLCFGNQY